jgi:amino acid adenylation domain-containing protein
MTVIDYGLIPPADFTPMPDSVLESAVVTRFEEMAETFPARRAIEAEGHSLTYQELNRAANQLAHRILAEMGEDKSPVAFLFHNEVLAVIALLAVSKTGRIYIGLHPGGTPEQLAANFADSTASLLIVSPDLRSLAESAIAGKNVRLLNLDSSRAESDLPNPGLASSAREPHAIFYTSGSTGRPKGVLVSHVFLTQWAQYQANDWYLSPSDRIAMVTSVCYLAAHTSLMGALMNGGTLCLFDIKSHSAQAALDWIRDARLTIFRCTPSIFRSLFGQADPGLVFDNLRFITLGSEHVTAQDIALFKAHTSANCVLINNFASSEGGMLGHFVVTHRTPPFGDFLPAGYPAPGREFFLVDDNGKEVEKGQEGEIVIRSQYLSLGYWRQPELTAQKFRPDLEHPGFGFYFTGDRGRFLENGALEVLGRTDTQVKIRGFRVQLEEVDIALRSFPEVADAAAVAHRPKGGRGPERLMAYVSLREGKRLPVGKLREHLSARLPAYMIPSAFVQMESLPRTLTGKLARLQLPEPSNARPDLGIPFVAPRNPVEKKLAGIWEKILRVDGIGVDDNFFELGGDSLLASEVFVEIERAFEKRYPMNILLQHGTIAALAEGLQKLDAARPSCVVPLRVEGTLPPVFMVPGGGGDVISFKELVDALGEDQPAYGFQDFNVETQASIYVQGVERSAAEFIRAMKSVQSAGPYHLLGHSAGGLIAFEMAKQLRAAGEAVGLVGLLDTVPPYRQRRSASLRDRLLAHSMNAEGLTFREKVSYYVSRGKAFVGKWMGERKALRPLYQSRWAEKVLWRDPLRFAHTLMARYYPEPYEGSLAVYQVTQRSRAITWDVTAPWTQFALGGVKFVNVPGTHKTMIKQPHALALAEALRADLRAMNEACAHGEH